MSVHPVHILPSAVTLVGGTLGLLGASSLPDRPGLAAALLAASVALDTLDGALARRLGACSEFGRRLDWSLDVAVGHAVAFFSAFLWMIPVLAVVQAAALPWRGRVVSGRTAAVLLAFAFG